ncbi:SsrA-binding protein SmpB, partial [bacterium]|nr:SsrA-binding protein SmpB [bacterium]
MPIGSPEVKNRKVFHDYHIGEKFEAGLVLSGTEIKAVREGRVSLRDSHVIIEKGEAYVIGMAISHYANRGYEDHHPHRPRKLLLKKREIKKLARKVESKGSTIVPTRLYFNARGYA